MIEIVRFDHLSMAVAELDPQIELLESLFGFRYVGRFDEDGFVGANLEVPGSSGMGFELLAPSGPDSYLHRFLQGPHGPGVHHVAMQVTDVLAAAALMRAEGMEPWGLVEHDTSRHEHGEQPPGAPPEDRSVVYIHPRHGGHGFLFQLYSGTPWHPATPFVDDREHTLGIRAINHYAHAHHSRDGLADWYTRLFGMQLYHRSPGPASPPGGGFQTAVLDTPTRQLRIEIISPGGEDSFIARFLARRGPSVHHVTFEVHDWDRAVAACAHHDIETFGERAGETHGVAWREAFIHPRDTGGMLTQFFWQAQPGVWV